jgi:hypothetical protein
MRGASASFSELGRACLGGHPTSGRPSYPASDHYFTSAASDVLAFCLYPAPNHPHVMAVTSEYTGVGSSERLRLPACERCRLKKVKCDSLPPKCSTCVKSDTACIIVDPLTSERYTRDGIAQLERKLKDLEAVSRTPATPSSVKSPTVIARSGSTTTHFVGDGR